MQEPRQQHQHEAHHTGGFDRLQACAHVVRQVAEQADLDAGRRELSWVVWSAALLAALFGLGAGLSSVRRLNTSLGRMARAAEARGDTDLLVRLLKDRQAQARRMS